MHNRKSYQIATFAVLMITFNYCGRMLADHFSLPIWMDSLGTVIATYVCDPFCGAVVGLTGNFPSLPLRMSIDPLDCREEL